MRYVKILIASILLLLVLTACGFVSYNKYPEATQASNIDELIAEYTERINSLTDESLYPEDERRMLINALIEARNALSECESEEELEEVFSHHSAIILSIATKLTRAILDASKQLTIIANENNYRAEQQRQVEWLLWYYGSQIEDAQSVEEVEALLRDFKTDLGNIKSDAQLAAEELETLKAKYSVLFGIDVDYSLYRSREREKIEAIEKEFRKEILNARSTAEADECRELYYSKISALKTDGQLLDEERADWCEEWRATLEDFKREYSLDISAEEIDRRILLIRTARCSEEAARLGVEFMLSYGELLGDASLELMQTLTATYFESYSTLSGYRAEQKKEINKAVADIKLSISAAESIDALADVKRQGNAKLAEIETNDAIWDKEDAEFESRMQSVYGELAINPPASLTVANSTVELARIIDYYAFYQLDGKSFERATFRVNLNYAHRYAEWVIRDVYWCCELLRSAVGITGYFEEDSSQLVITLIPYELASVSHTDTPVEITRHDSLIEYSSDSKRKDRAEDFDAFPYYELYDGRYATVWNSQQLWYALEHEYIPIPVKDSPAEAVLNRAKEILREIIKDGMTVEEKVFAIYSWYGDNVMYDYKISDYVMTDNRESFPDELVARLNCFHAEGALLDNLAVCCSYAKSCLILMRLEGIEAYRVILHEYEDNAIDNLGKEDYGSHAIIALKASDGKFYYCDVEQCGAGQDLIYEKFHQLLVSAKEQAPFGNCIDRIWKDKLDWGESLPIELFWNNLEYNGKRILVGSVEEAKAIIDEYCNNAEYDRQINIFTTEDMDRDIRALLNANNRISYNPYSYGGLNEYMIYCQVD